jgi:hypothetical protein
MDVYQAGDMWVLGLCGGAYEDLRKEPEAIISNKRPIPLKMWETPTIGSDVNGAEWEFDSSKIKHSKRWNGNGHLRTIAYIPKRRD